MSRCNCPQCNPVTGECPAAAELSALQKTVLRLMDEKLAVEAERDALKAWKVEACAVEAEWDAQAIASSLGAKLGESCRKVIAREVPKLQAKLTRCREALAARWKSEAAALRNPKPAGWPLYIGNNDIAATLERCAAELLDEPRKENP